VRARRVDGGREQHTRSRRHRPDAPSVPLARALRAAKAEAREEERLGRVVAPQCEGGEGLDELLLEVTLPERRFEHRTLAQLHQSVLKLHQRVPKLARWIVGRAPQ
jgi:hypothetical protein